MNTFNIHYAKTHLSKLVELAAKGEPFVIAKAGKPLVTVAAIEAPGPRKTSRLGFLAERFETGEFRVPDDVKAFMQDEIEAMFYGDEDLGPAPEAHRPTKP
jgi:antitoxin (DNA-binding transcriptional repressor) of toxin-antitoxin stability system